MIPSIYLAVLRTCVLPAVPGRPEDVKPARDFNPSRTPRPIYAPPGRAYSNTTIA